MQFKSLRTHLIIVSLLILIIPTSIIGVSSYWMAKQELDETGKLELVQSTNKTISMIKFLNDEVKAGTSTIEEAQEKLRFELLGEKNSDNTREFKEEHKLGDSGYIFAVDKDQIVVMTPENEGQDLKGVTSEDGVAIGEEFLKIGKEGGFVTYDWLNPITGKIEPKTTYVHTDPYWGWTIASSAYLSEFNSGASKISSIIFVITVAGVLIGALCIYFLAKNITNPLKKISHELNLAAAGDFTSETLVIKRRDEIGQLAADFNLTKDNIAALISQVAKSAEHVAASSEQLSASAEEASRATAEITQSIQEVAAGAEMSNSGLTESSQSLDEVTNAIQNLSENTNHVSKLGTGIVKQANEGTAYVNETVKQIHSISNRVNESSDVLQLLDSSSNEIGEITKVITAIADQTNLLALNATIEAARAGEHGKGFAVVADEVRKLAEQSQQSSAQISKLILDIQENMLRSTQSMDAVIVEVQEGLTVVNKTEENFKEIVTNMNNMERQVTEMAATVEQMSASAEEVSATVNNIVHTTNATSAQTQQVAAATEEQLASIEDISHSSVSLSKLATELQKQVGQFKI